MSAVQKYLLSFFWATLLLPACAHHEADAVDRSSDHFEISVDGTAKVSGAVTANHADCAAGGSCYLVLNLPEREVHVVYRTAGGCENADAAKIAADFKPGDIIDAEGVYLRDGATGIVDVCAKRGGTLEKDEPAAVNAKP